MVQERHKTKASLLSKVLSLLLINSAALAGLAWAGWKLHRGEIELDALPEGLTRNTVYLAVALVVLIIVVTAILPLAHAPARALRRSLKTSAAIRSECGPGRLVLELVLWPFRQIFYVVFWLLRAACFLASFALIAATLFFGVRIFVPELGDAWLPEPVDVYADRWVAWAELLVRR